MLIIGLSVAIFFLTRGLSGLTGSKSDPNAILDGLIDSGGALTWSLFLLFWYFNWSARPLRKLCEQGAIQSGAFVRRKRLFIPGWDFIIFTHIHLKTGKIQELSSPAPNTKPFANLKPGDPVTVLYDPKDLERVIVYETSGWKIVDGFEVAQK